MNTDPDQDLAGSGPPIRNRIRQNDADPSPQHCKKVPRPRHLETNNSVIHMHKKVIVVPVMRSRGVRDSPRRG